jgi:hypothetical protein
MININKYRIVFFTFVAICLFSSCAYKGREIPREPNNHFFDDAVNTWVGRNIEELISVWGPQEGIDYNKEDSSHVYYWIIEERLRYSKPVYKYDPFKKPIDNDCGENCSFGGQTAKCTVWFNVNPDNGIINSVKYGQSKGREFFLLLAAFYDAFWGYKGADEIIYSDSYRSNPCDWIANVKGTPKGFEENKNIDKNIDNPKSRYVS